MKKDNIFLPQDFYEQRLTSIGEIAFTKREIDVIACLAVGKDTQNIAALLEISERTVHTHYTKINGKFGCDKKSIGTKAEELREFSALKAHYTYLKIEKAFKKTLRKLRRENSSTTSYCIEDRYANKQDNKCVSNLLSIKSLRSPEKPYLELVNVLPRKHKTDAVRCFSLYPLSQEFKDSFDETTLTEPLIVLNFGDKFEQGIIAETNVLHVKDYDNPYSLVFQLLRYLLPEVNFDESETEFKQQCNLLQNNLSTSSEHTLTPNLKLNPKALETRVFFSWKKAAFGVSLCLFLVGYFVLKQNLQLQTNQHSERQVRSDLLIPPEMTLLKRTELIKKIENKLNQKSGIQKVALVGVVGMGGVGKTTIARHMGRLHRASIIWELNAETKQSLIDSFKKLAVELAQTAEQEKELNFILAIKNSEEREKQIFSFVKKRLKSNSDWLLIYDNIENFSEITHYLPRDPLLWGNGKVIVTTRDNNIKDFYHIKPQNIIEIGELTASEALTLFCKVLFSKELEELSLNQQQEASKFLKHIPSFPLDVSLTAYYIKNHKLTYVKYLERLEAPDADFQNAQAQILKEATTTDYTKTRYKIITLSLKEILENNPSFSELFLFISLLDSQQIPIELLSLYKDKLDVDTFIQSLRTYSLITNEPPAPDNSGVSTFSIHRSTQSISLAYFTKLIQQNEKNKVLNNLISKLKSYHQEYIRSDCQKIVHLISHLESISKKLHDMKINKILEDKLEIEMHLLIGYAHYTCSRNLILAKKHLRLAYDMMHRNNSLPIETTATLLKDLGNICATSSANDECIFYCQESMKFGKKIPNSEILISENLKNMGYAYHQQNDFNKAKNCFEVALKNITKVEPKVKMS